MLQTGEPIAPIDSDARPMRAMNVTDALLDAGHEVTLWTTDFSHQSLSHRFGKNMKVQTSRGLQIRLIHSPGYKRNIGLGRMRDHALLAHRLRRMLLNESPPDVAFVGFPPIEVAWVLTGWLANHQVPVLLDVKDQWPEVFLRPLPQRLNAPARAALEPYFWMTKRAMSDSSGISSISPEFLDWSLNMVGRTRTDADCVLPLTCREPTVGDQARADAGSWWDHLGVPDDGRFRAIYVGSMNSAVDFDTILRAARANDGQFVICGDGPMLDPFRLAAMECPNIVIPGWINEAQSRVLGSRSSVALVPYVGEQGFELGIPNKVYDAMSAGLPIVTTNAGAVERLVVDADIGIFCDRHDFGLFESELARLSKEPTSVERMSVNTRALYETRFSYEKVYGGLVAHLETMASAKRSIERKVPRDVDTERQRYDRAAEVESTSSELLRGVEGSPRQFHPPYFRYWEHIDSCVGPDDVVLELGAGSGRHTERLAKTSGEVIALDVSEKSLKLGVERAGRNVSPVCADMEDLPFVDNCFDIVASAGSLSYGDPSEVDAEVYRVLKDGGTLLVVDSLNHNPIYRLNRWVQYRRGQRSLSTIQRIPDIQRIESLSRQFDSVRVEFFGSWLFMFPLASRVVGPGRALEIFADLDGKKMGERLAFKFVLVAKGFRRKPES
mgnify:CR=1 FL=1